jgi:hypothetical protein
METREAGDGLPYVRYQAGRELVADRDAGVWPTLANAIFGGGDAAALETLPSISPGVERPQARVRLGFEPMGREIGTPAGMPSSPGDAPGTSHREQFDSPASESIGLEAA